MKTKLFSSIGVLALACTVHSVHAQFTYSIFKGEVTISGYVGLGGDITIPDMIEDLPVTSIGQDAFNGITTLTRITIPNSVTSIRNRAFNRCTGLTSIAIPDSVASIGLQAFYRCTGLTSILIGNSVTNIGYGAFQDCASLTNITIPDSVVSIAGASFDGCSSLTAIDVRSLNPSFSSLEGVLFSKGLMTLIKYPEGKVGDYTIPDGVIDMVSPAFADCTGLTSVIIPDSMTRIGYRAFDNCTSLVSVIIGNNVTNILYGAFRDCTSLTSVTIPDSVTSIEDIAFYRCAGLTNVTIGNSLTNIPNGAFGGCTSLTSVTIPDSVTNIGDSALFGCTSLTNVNIGNNVTSIGETAFSSCSSLTVIDVRPFNPSYSSSEGVLFNKDRTALLKHPQGKVGAYTIPGSVISIEPAAFGGSTRLTGVIIPDSVISIGDQAFWGCTSLSSVTIGNGVMSIGTQAFTSCTSLTSFIIPDSVVILGSGDWGGGVFYGCSGLTNVKIGHSVTSLLDYDEGRGWNSHGMFEECSNLRCITIPDSVASIGTKAFDGCYSLTAIDVEPLNPSYSSLEGDLFNKDQTVLLRHPPGKVGDYTIPDSVTLIGGRTFFDCANLTSVTIGNNVTNIGYLAFAYCVSLTSIIIPDNVSNLGGGVFFGCYGLTNVQVGQSVTSLPDDANTLFQYANGTFEGCFNLGSITIPDSVTFLGEKTFAYCTSLTSIYFLGNSPSFRGSFFEDRNVTIYYLPGTMGWSGDYSGRPTALWLPIMKREHPCYGLPEDPFGFTISWASGKVVVVDAASSLTSPNWVPVSTNTIFDGISTFTDPDSADHVSRFYRLREQ